MNQIKHGGEGSDLKDPVREFCGNYFEGSNRIFCDINILQILNFIGKNLEPIVLYNAF